MPKITCLDTVSGYTKAGKPYTRGAFRSIGKSGQPYLFLATCPDDYVSGEEYNVSVAFSPNRNYILPY